MAKVSPLHGVIDAARWDAERPLGRLILVVHAAFLDAGLVPLPHHPSSRNRRPVLRSAGRTASALSLRYTAPELLSQQDAESAAVVLRQQVHGHRIAFYVQRGGDGDEPAAPPCVLVDTLDAAALLSGGLDATARALRRDAALAELWRGLWDRLCRRALVELCREYGVVARPETTFTSLPGDVKAAILGRLRGAADLARVEATCAALRRLVAERDRELWKPRYDALLPPASVDQYDADDSPEMSWKQRYLRARLTRPTPSQRIVVARIGWSSRTFRLVISPHTPLYINDPDLSTFDSRVVLPPFSQLHRFGLFARPRDEPPELPADPVADRRRQRTAVRGKPAAGSRRAPPSHGQEKRRHGAGAIHAPSSRYRWKHR